MSSSIITDDALRYMENNTLDHINLWRFMESSKLFEFCLTNLYKTTSPSISGVSFINISNYKLERNRAKTALGTYITVNKFKDTYRFPSVRNLYTPSDVAAQVSPVLQSLYDRGHEAKKSFHVFVNGIKVPDEEAYVFISQKSTELYLSTDWFIDNVNGIPYPNNLACVDKNFSDCSYNNWYKTGLTSDKLIGIPLFSVNNGERRRIAESTDLVKTIVVNELTGETETVPSGIVQVWVNGKHIPISEYRIVPGSDSFNVIFKNGKPSDSEYNAEVIIDKTILGRYSERQVSDTGKLLVYLPKDAPEINVDSSIFIHMADVYVDGLRICTNYLVQKTHRHIMVNAPSFMGLTYSSSEIVLSDKSEAETSMAQYVNDFMEYEKWGSDEDNAKAILDNDSHLIVSPEFVSSNSMVYPPPNNELYSLNRMIDSFKTNDEKAYCMLDENSHYLRNLLKYYQIKEETYDDTKFVDSDSTNTNIILDLDSSDNENINTRMMEVVSGGKKIDGSLTTLVSRNNSDFITISTNKIVNDKVIMYRYPTSNLNQKYIRFSAIALANNIGEYITIDSNIDAEGDLGDFDINDLRVFEVTDRTTDTERLFVDIPGASVYYKLVEKSSNNYVLRLDPTNNSKIQMMIPNGSSIDVTKPIIIMNPKFHGYRTYNVIEQDKYSTSRIHLNMVINGEVIPFVIDDYLIKVYRNGSIMLPYTDWFIITPDDMPTMTSSMIIFRRNIEANDTIEIEYTGIRNKYLASYVSVPSTNKYGFIFFDRLQIPFSMEYMDLYVNGKKLSNDDVVVYSDRLIRVNENTPLPFYDIVLCTRLKIDYDKFENYITYANNKVCDFDEYVKRFCANEIFEDNFTMDNRSNTDINTIYEDSGDDGTGKIPNPITPVDERPIIIRFDTLMNRLQYDYNRKINLMSKYFDSNVYKSIVSAEYLILVSKESMEGHFIRFDSNNSKEQMAATWYFDPNEQFRTRGQIITLMYNMFKDGTLGLGKSLDSNLTIDEESILLKKYLYKSDIVELDSNIIINDITKNLILNSNTILEDN